MEFSAFLCGLMSVLLALYHIGNLRMSVSVILRYLQFSTLNYLVVFACIASPLDVHDPDPIALPSVKMRLICSSVIGWSSLRRLSLFDGHGLKSFGGSGVLVMEWVRDSCSRFCLSDTSSSYA